MSTAAAEKSSLLGRIAGAVGRRGFSRNVAIMMGGVAGGQLITMASYPLLTRIYSPDQFGLLAVFASLLSPLLVVACGRFEQAIPLPKSDRRAANLLAVSLACVAATTLLGAVVVVVTGDRIAGALNAPGLAPYLWLLPLGVLVGGLYAALSYWIMRRQKFSLLSTARMRQSLLRAVSQCGLGLITATPIGLLVGDVAGRGGGLGAVGADILRRDRAPFRAISPRRALRAAARYARFPLVAMPSALLNLLGTALPLLVLPEVYGIAEAGFFFVALTLTSWPVNLLATSVSQVFYADTAACRNEPQRVLDRFLQLSWQLGVLSLVGAAVLATCPWWAHLLLGAKWQGVGLVMAGMAPMLVGRLVVSPMSQAYYLYNKQHVLLLLDGLRLTLVAGVLYACRRAGAPLTMTVLYFSLSILSVYVLHWLAIYRMLRQADNQPRREARLP